MGTDAPRTRRHRGLRFLIVVLVTVLVLGVAAAGFGWWTVQRSFPTTSGRIDVPGLTATVTVYRDDAGIPQLVAETDHDLFFAQGYVHAQDRFWEMDFRRHVTAGRVAELFGESQVATDAFIRTLDWRGIAEQEYALLDPVSRAYYEAYAAGRERLPRQPRRRRPLARVRRARPAEPGLHPRAVDAGRLHRVAEGHGLGPPVEPRRRDRPGAARERAPARGGRPTASRRSRGTRCPRS